MTFEKEITVETKLSFEELDKVLKENGFVIKEVYDVFDKYLTKKEDIDKSDCLKTLSKSILIRNVKDGNDKKYIMYKYKKYNKNNEIVKQGSIKCNTDSLEKAEELFNALEYYKLIEINDHITVYANDKTELNVQEVNGKHIYIEMEQTCNYVNKKYINVNEMIYDLESYLIPYEKGNYYVKKAEIELKEELNLKE